MLTGGCQMQSPMEAQEGAHGGCQRNPTVGPKRGDESVRPARATSTTSGNGSDKRQCRVVINADDFGWDDDVVDATIRCFRNGLMTSATISVTTEGATRALKFAKQNPQFSFGVHLCIGWGRPVSDPRDIPSLVDRNGWLLSNHVHRRRGVCLGLRTSEVLREFSAQLDCVAGYGVPISHVDTHGHVHKLPQVMWALRLAAKRHGISKVRLAQNMYTKPRRRSPTYWLGGAANVVLRTMFTTTDYFFNPEILGCPGDWWSEFLHALRPGCTELGVHPGLREPWRRTQTLPLLGVARDALLHRGVQLITYNDVGEVAF